VQEAQGYDCPPEEAQAIVKVHIHNLRRKMGLSSQRPPRIVNLRGVGYMFDRRARKRKESTNQMLT